MKTISLLCLGLFLCVWENTYAQPLTIQWQKCLGGSLGDGAAAIKQYSNGDILVGGSTISNDGDVSGNHSLNHNDIWITRLDSTGILLWQRCYGGTLDEQATSLLITDDGGFICAGFTTSMDGDLTGVNIPGNGDYWVFKCDSSGTIEWQNCYGGSNEDLPDQIIQSYEGGYALIGRTDSYDHDVIGLHDTLSTAFDIWVTRIDSMGNIQWAKCFGGTANDLGISIALCPDSGYVIFGNTYSNDGDINGSHGAWDYWVAKIDKMGNIQWGKCYGGFFEEGSPAFGAQGQIITDITGGYVFLGQTNSFDGDVTGSHGGPDCWLVKLDSAGIIQWQKCLGGTSIDWGNSVCQISDSTYVILSSTSSNDGDITGHHYQTDFWVANIDLSGDIIWQNCYGGNCIDNGSSIAETIDGGLIFVGGTCSNDGDVSGNHGQWDMWVVKLAPLHDGISTPQNPITDFSLYQNQNNETIDVSFYANGNEKINLQLIDITGRVLLQKIISASSGFNKQQLQTPNTGTGVYLMRLQNNGGAVTKKLVVY